MSDNKNSINNRACGKSRKQSDLNITDYFALFLVAFCTFLLFSQPDVIITGNNGIIMQGGPFDFYTRSYEFWGEYGANYLPSTFLIYAIWNIPIRLLGATVHTVTDTSLWQVYWYKLLPCIVFVICAWQVYQLCQQLKFDKAKSRFASYAFMTAPLAFFSQFIFCQYDIFTVFFILLALRVYFGEKSGWKELALFSLCFGIAFTFKYHAVLFFLILLFLKVKKIPQAIGYSLLSALPALAEILFCLIFDRDSFQKAVMEFSALEYAADTGGIAVGFSTLNLMVLCTCLLLAWSYFTHPQTQRDFVCDSFFFCSGICVTLFGLMAWHPQWLLLGVVFWIISASLNQCYDSFLWLDMLEIAVFYCLTVIKFAGNVDQTMLSHGVLHKWLYRKELDTSVSMRDILHVANVDDGILYSVFLAILLIRFIFSHRKFCSHEISHSVGNIWLLRLRMWCGILLFTVPALLCLPDMLSQKTILEDGHNGLSVDYVLDLENREVIQDIILKGTSVSKVQLFTGTFGKELGGTTLSLQIREAETGRIIGESLVSNEQIMENAYTDFVFDDVQVQGGSRYQFIINVTSVGEAENVTVYYYEEEDWRQEEDAADFQLTIGGERLESSLLMRVMGTPEEE